MTKSTAEAEHYTLHYRINGQDIECSVPTYAKASSTLRQNNIPSVQTGCGTEGSCGTCVVWVDGKARMSCTLKSQALNKAHVLSLEGISAKFQRQLSNTFEQFGISQCGYCLTAIQLHTAQLLQAIPVPSREDILSMLQLHTCRCISADIMVDAIQSLLPSNEPSGSKHHYTDGWEPQANRLTAHGRPFRISDITLCNLLHAFPVFADRSVVNSLEPPKNIQLIWSKDLLLTQTPNDLQYPTPIAFLLSEDIDGLRHFTEAFNLYQLPLDGFNFSQSSASVSPSPIVSTSSNHGLTFTPTEIGLLENDMCIVHNQEIWVNGVESNHLQETYKDYTIHNHCAGGSFGHRTLTCHIDWAIALAKLKGQAVSLRIETELQLRLRPKRPALHIECLQAERQKSSFSQLAFHLQSPSSSALDDWYTELLLALDSLLHLQYPNATLRLTHSPLDNSFEAIPQQSSLTRTLQVLGWVCNQLEILSNLDPLSFRIQWAHRLAAEGALPPAWMKLIEEQAGCYVQAQQEHPERFFGWGLCALPERTHSLKAPLRCAIHIAYEDEIYIEMGLPESDGALASTVIQIIHRATGIPKEILHYRCTDTHPFPGSDPDELRPHWIYAAQEVADVFNAQLKQHSLQPLVGQRFEHEHRELHLSANATSVVVSMNAKGILQDCWIAMDVGWTPSMAQAKATISGRWMRAQGKEMAFNTKGQSISQFKDIKAYKAKEIPNMHWTLTQSSTDVIPWSTVDGAIFAAIQHARTQGNLSANQVPFPKIRR